MPVPAGRSSIPTSHCAVLRWAFCIIQRETPVNDNTLGHGATTWAVVLAGGDGRRLQALTHDADGIPVPKQFCSLQGGPCLLEDAIQRASTVAGARALIDQGALWNAFIIAGSVWALLRLFDGSFSSTIVSISHIVEHRIELEGDLFDQLYERLPSVDFSHGVLEGRESTLQVLPVPRCGWTDLGTPQRIGMALQRLRQNFDAPPRHTSTFHLNLAEQYARGNQSAVRMPAT